MSNTFDDLFNEFFKRNNIRPEDKINDAMKQHAQRMIDMLSHFSELTDDDNLEKQIDEQFGKPDKIECFNEGDLFIERRIWHTSQGDIIKTIVSDDPTMLRQAPMTIERLDEKLKEALEHEEYEKAAAIRDEIKKRKKVAKKLDK
jgi:excinuclease UvrABC helicase subunit UvrB